MKFKFKGVDGQQDMALIQAGIMDESEKLEHGQIVDVTKKSGAISRLEENGLWEKVKSGTNITVPKPVDNKEEGVK